ncbi:MAG TPA: sugar ABC transporter permease [Actinomycetota bacterium]|nr:sugar ABC transporter permease [Actinomycetota bacterium]
MMQRLKHALLFSDGWFKQLLVLPMQAVIWAVLVVPLLIAIYLSFVDWEPISGREWWQAPFAGVANYKRALLDPRFQSAFVRTLVLVLTVVSVQLVLGLALAVLFNTKFPARRFYSSILLFPMMLPWVVVGLIFFVLFLEQGPINYLLIGVFGPDRSVDWLGRPLLALLAIGLGDVWQWTPFMFLVIYSALAAVPPEPIEAAKTLGASEWQIFRRITVPAIMPVILIALLIRGLEAFKIFDLIFIMTGGGPGTSTESISLYLYRTGFVFGQLSFASAAAILVLVFVVLVSWAGLRPLRTEVEL